MTFVMLGNTLIVLVNLDDAQERLNLDDDDVLSCQTVKKAP